METLQVVARAAASHAEPSNHGSPSSAARSIGKASTPQKRRPSSSKVGTYAYVNPVVAVLLGWAFLDETVTARLLLGGLTILGGLLLVYFARVRESGASRTAL